MNTPSTPSTPSSPAERAALAAQLAQELAGLRDALMTLSLSLKDWQFELDVDARRAAQRQLDEALSAFRARPAPCDKRKP